MDVKRKLLIVSNRLPVRVESTAEGMRTVPSEGGLATGLASLSSSYDKEWIGWPGIHTENEAAEKELSAYMPEGYHPVFLNHKEEELYYKGFSNETLWPLFHYFMESTQYRNDYWEEYKKVNQKFCDRVVEAANEGDIIWIQDYHLMLLPAMLRERLGDKNPIGFFMHIPFPSYELFRTLPWRKELLNGLLGANLVGFHTFEYMRHFMNTAYRVLGFESRLGAINANGRMVYTDAYPMGINFEKFNQVALSEKVTQQSESLRDRFGPVKLILSVDRLDYTKGIKNRLEAFDALLTEYPQLREKVSLIMLTVPSRDSVSNYRDLKVEVDELVGKINGKHSTLSWTAVHYMYRSLDFEKLVALYNVADIGLVTPLRDGMNLVAKEFVASRSRGDGVLILSEMAGAAIELDGALRINPNDRDSMVEAMFQAVHMSRPEQEERIRKMQQQIKMHSVEKWGSDFTSELTAMFEKEKKKEKNMINGKETLEITGAFTGAENKLIILDYDGTLMPFCDNPYDAKPCDELKQMLTELSKHATVVLSSGRDHFTMEEWFGDLNIELVAEHGVWNKEHGQWKQVRGLSSAWKEDIYPLLRNFVEKTPGSFIEEKPYSLAYHYRRTDSWLAEIRAPQLLNVLASACELKELNVVDGNKVIEVRIPGVDKGSAAYKWLAQKDWDFIMTIGDDKTDEDMFAVMPEHAYTIKVGVHETKAKMRIRNCAKVRELLQSVLDAGKPGETGMRLVYKKAI